MSFHGLTPLPYRDFYKYNLRIRRNGGDQAGAGDKSKRGLYPDPDELGKMENERDEAKKEEQINQLQAQLFVLWQDLGE